MFHTRQNDFWDDVDSFQRSGGWIESDEEAAAYDALVTAQVQEGNRTHEDLNTGAPSSFHFMNDVSGAAQAARIPVVEARNQDEDPVIRHASAGEISLQASTSAALPPPSFHFSQIAHMSTPRLQHNSTLPSVPTPGDTRSTITPAPFREAVTSKLHSRHAKSVVTPENIPSPENTPSSSRHVHRIGEGHGRRDDPATPVPLGTAAFAKLKGKKDYQTLTKHFEAFAKTAARQNISGLGAKDAKGKGRAFSKVHSMSGLGGKVFEGSRFCIPPELGQVMKHKQRWDIVSSLFSISGS